MRTTLQSCWSTSRRAKARAVAEYRVGWRERNNEAMNSIIYLVGLVVIVLAILGFLGLR